MRKGVEFVVGAIIAGGVAVIISSERAEMARLKNQLEFLQSQYDGGVRRNTEPNRVHDAIAQPDRPNEPSREVLRLRGEVGRLRGELESVRQERDRDGAKAEDHEPSSASVSDQLAVTEIDLNRFMDFPNGATTNEVLVELQRLGAQVVAQEQGFIEAGLSVPTTNAGLSPSVLLEFYFEGDRLSSKKYSRLPW